MFRWTYIALFTLPTLLSAQVSSNKGRFAVSFDRGCIPLTVNIMVTDTFGNIERDYLYFEGAVNTTDTTFTYTEPGIFQIIQVNNEDGVEDRLDTLVVEAVLPEKPSVLFSQCTNLEVAVQSIDSLYDFIRVYFEGTDSVDLRNSEQSSYTFPTEGNQVVRLKGFFDDAPGICTNFFEETVAASSLAPAIIESASIKETCREVYAMFINLNTVDTLVNYRVYLEQETRILVFDGFLDTTFLAIGDIPLSFDTEYCITIETFDPCNDISQLGTFVCDFPTALSVSPFESLYATYTDSSSIFVHLEPVNSGLFEIQRRFDGGEFETRPPTTGSFNDPIGSLSRRYFYSIDYRDSCDNILYSAETHPPLVASELIGTNEYLVTFSEALNSLSTLLESAYEIGNPGSQTSRPIASTLFPLRLEASNGVPRQSLSASSAYDQNVTLQSNTITLRYELIIHVPKAFTPNDDGLNDRLEFFGLPSENATISIYNRWGQLVYTSDAAVEGWDGMIAGSKAPEGTYLYEIVFETINGDKQRQKGTFALINN